MKTIIFDFDGTIADNLSVAINIYNKIADKYQTNKVAKEELPVYRSMKPFDILRKLEITAFKLPFIVATIRKQMKRQIIDIPIFADICNILKQLKDKGFDLGILSSNSVQNIKIFLDHYQINLFNYIFSCKNIFGKHKSLTKFIKNYNLKKGNVIYIGDEIRDIDASRKAGVRIISACWGYNDKDSLYAENPESLAEKPADLLKFF